MPLFTLKDHINTLAPFSPNETLVMLHNLGSVRGRLGARALASDFLGRGGRLQSRGGLRGPPLAALPHAAAALTQRQSMAAP
jgi:hypothetical protein